MKLVVSQKNGKSYQKEFETLGKLLNKKIGDEVSGDEFGLNGYELEITGGSDSDGFPMRKDVQGTQRKKVLIAGGVGFKPKNRGERRKRSVRGNTVSTSINQVNTKIVKKGKKPVPELWEIKKEEKQEPEKKEEKPKKKAEKKEEPEKKEKKEKKPKKEEKGK